MGPSSSACWASRSSVKDSPRSRPSAAGVPILRRGHRRRRDDAPRCSASNWGSPTRAREGTMNQPSAAGDVRIWVAGDWNGFFGLFTNVLLNVIVLTGLCLGVVQLPADTVFGRILPALGIALPLGNLYYAWLAYKLAQKEGRTDVAAMPYGPSVPHMFIVVFVIMLPVYLKTKDPLLAWQAGLAWAFIIGVIVLAGIFFCPRVRAHPPRAAMLGTLAGISIAFISLRPAFQMWEVPWIAFISLAIVLISWTANTRLPFGLPGGLAAVIVGIVVGWVAYFAGWSDVVK